MSNDERRIHIRHSSFVLRISLDIRHLGIRHYPRRTSKTRRHPADAQWPLVSQSAVCYGICSTANSLLRAPLDCRIMKLLHKWFWIMSGLGLWLANGQTVWADLITYRDQQGKQVDIEARLIANEREMFVLELDNGEYRIVPERAVEKRIARDGPRPASAAEILSRLEKHYGATLFRGYKQDPYVLGLILAEPLPKNGEARATASLKQSANFLKGVDAAFGSFVKELQIPVRAPTHPQVVLIFETDELFEKYAREAMQGQAQALAARSISGFYSGLSNVLAIRMSECFTFDVPLHEAIHQQVYNRHMFQRLAPIPHWFDEGIATGFEGNRGRISQGPTKVTARYARQALEAKVLTWEQVLSDDKVFTGDVLVGEAYGDAWAMHWLLITKYRNQYGKYVRQLAEKTPLGKDSPAQRLEEFRALFGEDLGKLRKEFRVVLDTAIKRQKISLATQEAPGLVKMQKNLAQLELRAIRRLDRGGALEVDGKLFNLSPLRSMSFLLSVETDGGEYAQWLFPDVNMNQTVSVGLKQVRQPVGDTPPRPSNTFRIRVRAAPATGPLAERWRKGELPAPGDPSPN